MNRQKLLLLVLVALLAAAIAYAIFASPRQERVPAQTGKQSARPRPETRGKETGSAFGPSVRLELLEKEKVKFPGVRRDLFGTLFVEKPPAPPPPPPPPVVAPPPPPPPVDVVRQELARFTFLGFLKKEGEWTIFLSSGGEIFLVQKGDRFGRGGEFHASEITPERLTIRRGEEGSPIVIPLVEQGPLVPMQMRTSGRSSTPPTRPFGFSPARPQPVFPQDSFQQGGAGGEVGAGGVPSPEMPEGSEPMPMQEVPNE